ncbi:MAG TPA: chromate efflux transporter [Acidimicrobiia bacterium]
MTGPESDHPVAEVARLFGRMGLTAFGGPAAHISMMHDEVVTRRGWLDDRRFLDLIGVTNLIPGPNSTEMAMHVGHQRAGWRGLLAAGVSFIVPAALITLAFAWAYVEYGSTPGGEAILYGIEPVVVVIIAQALVKLGRSAMQGWLTGVIAVVAAITYLFGVNELLILAAGAALVLVLRTSIRSDLLTLAAIGAGGWAAAEVAGTDQISLGRLFLVFLEVGAFLYGSGYVLLAFLQNDLVDQLGVLTQDQLLDAVAIGQLTPGPVFTTATFVGYVLAGLPGAAVATVGIFLPAFVFVGAVTPIVRRIRDRVWTAALLDGVSAAALGLMAGVTLQLSRDGLVDPFTVGIAAVAALLLWRTRVNSAWLILGGALAGLAAEALGSLPT